MVQTIRSLTAYMLEMICLEVRIRSTGNLDRSGFASCYHRAPCERPSFYAIPDEFAYYVLHAYLAPATDEVFAKNARQKQTEVREEVLRVITGRKSFDCLELQRILIL